MVPPGSSAYLQHSERDMRKIMQIFALTMATSLLGPALLAVRAQDNSPKQNIKDAGHDTKNAAKDTGKATKGAAKKTGHAVKKGTNKAAAKTDEGAKKVENKTSDQPKSNN